ncbi:MAG: CRISPR-associated endonuclease Cas2 [Nitrospirae bacterium]|nr:CRISPR-associated endonuclease Cas2 [Nitrospirota bacterium]
MEEHFYLVTYDISDQRRWRRFYRLMKGYGEWLQLSVFQCRLSQRRRAEMMEALSESIKHDQDHVLIMDIGPADMVKPKVTSLGKAFEPIKRETMIV